MLDGVVTEPPAPIPRKNDIFSKGRRQRKRQHVDRFTVHLLQACAALQYLRN